MEPKRIHTLAELQEEQMKLRIRMASSKKEFLRSVEHTTVLGRQMLVQKVGVVAGAAALGVAVKRKFFSDGTNKMQESSASGTKHHWLLQFLLTAAPLVLQFLSNNNSREAFDDEPDADEGIAPAGFFHENPTAGKWWAALIPLAVTLIQQLLENEDEPAIEKN